jgi:hypothetical protein
MVYKKINLELIVATEESDGVVAELNSALNRLDEGHTIFGGGIEVVTIHHAGMRKKSALMHTRAARETAIGAIKSAGERVASAFREIL